MLRRILDLIRGLFSLLALESDPPDPEDRLEREIARLELGGEELDHGLASHRALCERLRNEVGRLEESKRKLAAKVSTAIERNDRLEAGRVALAHRELERELAARRALLEQADREHGELFEAREGSVAAIRKRIEELRRSAADLRRREARAVLQQLADRSLEQGRGEASDSAPNRPRTSGRNDSPRAPSRGGERDPIEAGRETS